MTTSAAGTVVRTAGELFALWQLLTGEGGFARRSLWIIFFDDEQRLQPVVVPIDDLPPEPDAVAVRNLSRIVADLIDTGEAASVALLVSRDGPTAMSDADRRWARALQREFAPALTPWPVHLATRDRLQVFAPDDLIAA